MTTSDAPTTLGVVAHSVAGTTGGQTFKLDRVEKVPAGDYVRLVRFVVKIDASYSHQSDIHADLWMPGRGWVEAVRVLGDDPAVAALAANANRILAPGHRESILMRIVNELLREPVQTIGAWA